MSGCDCHLRCDRRRNMPILILTLISPLCIEGSSFILRNSTMLVLCCTTAAHVTVLDKYIRFYDPNILLRQPSKHMRSLRLKLDPYGNLCLACPTPTSLEPSTASGNVFRLTPSLSPKCLSSDLLTRSLTSELTKVPWTVTTILLSLPKIEVTDGCPILLTLQSLSSPCTCGSQRNTTRDNMNFLKAK